MISVLFLTTSLASRGSSWEPIVVSKGCEAGVGRCENIDCLGLKYSPKGRKRGPPKLRKLYEVEWSDWWKGKSWHE